MDDFNLEKAELLGVMRRTASSIKDQELIIASMRLLKLPLGSAVQELNNLHHCSAAFKTRLEGLRECK